MSYLEDKFKAIEAKDVEVNIKGSKLVLRYNNETKLINVMSGDLGSIACNINGDVLGNVNGIVFGSLSTINKEVKMKDKIIKMGDSEIVLSYDSKTKLISVDSDSLGTIVGNIAGNVVGAIEGNVHDGIGGFVGNSIDGNVMGSICGIVFDDVFKVMGKVGGKSK